MNPHESDATRVLPAAEVLDIDRRARFNGAVSRVEIRQLCATIRTLRATADRLGAEVRR